MTATNHALTGAVVALALKRPELALPAAFLSHFVIDMIPHYNPPGASRHNFKSYSASWTKKMDRKSFKIIFALDMVLLLVVMISLPFLSPPDVSPATVFLGMLLAISPDFVGGFQYLISAVSNMKFKNGWFTKIHIRLQLLERPWGIYIELVWAAAMLAILNHLAV